MSTLCVPAAHQQPWGAIVPHLPVPTLGSAHHSLRSHLLLAVHAALPESEWQELVQVSHLLRGRPHGRPEEVDRMKTQYLDVERRNNQNNDLLLLLQCGRYGNQAVCSWWRNHHASDEEGKGLFGGNAQLSVGEGRGTSSLRGWETITPFLFWAIFCCFFFFFKSMWLFPSPDTRLSPYSKLLLTSPSQALRMVEEEKAVLQAQLSLEDDAQGCFIQSALCLLKVATAAFYGGDWGKWSHHSVYLSRRMTCCWNFRSEKKCCWSSRRWTPPMFSRCHLSPWRKSLLLWWMSQQRQAALRWV